MSNPRLFSTNDGDAAFPTTDGEAATATANLLENNRTFPSDSYLKDIVTQLMFPDWDHSNKHWILDNCQLVQIAEHGTPVLAEAKSTTTFLDLPRAAWTHLVNDYVVAIQHGNTVAEGLYYMDRNKTLEAILAVLEPDHDRLKNFHKLSRNKRREIGNELVAALKNAKYYATRENIMSFMEEYSTGVERQSLQPQKQPPTKSAEEYEAEIESLTVENMSLTAANKSLTVKNESLTAEVKLLRTEKGASDGLTTRDAGAEEEEYDEAFNARAVVANLNGQIIKLKQDLLRSSNLFESCKAQVKNSGNDLELEKTRFAFYQLEAVRDKLKPFVACPGVTPKAVMEMLEDIRTAIEQKDIIAFETWYDFASGCIQAAESFIEHERMYNGRELEIHVRDEDTEQSDDASDESIANENDGSSNGSSENASGSDESEGDEGEGADGEDEGDEDEGADGEDEDEGAEHIVVSRSPSPVNPSTETSS